MTAKSHTEPQLTQKELLVFLEQVALARPIFIWGPPGIGKTALVEHFAQHLKLPCVSLLGSQINASDLLGIPQITDGTYRYCPPRYIARDEPYCLFLDELNACSHDVQKALYSLVHEKRIGEYVLPPGSVIIGAGNRLDDGALALPMSSALLNRMIHVHLVASAQDWLEWAEKEKLHMLVLQSIRRNPSHLWTSIITNDTPFSTPRAWHLLSDALKRYESDIPDKFLKILAYGCLSPEHAAQFLIEVRTQRSAVMFQAILAGNQVWPHKLEDRELLSFLADAFYAHLVKVLPSTKAALIGHQEDDALQCTRLFKKLADIDLKIAHSILSKKTENVPQWFSEAMYKDIPQLGSSEEES